VQKADGADLALRFYQLVAIDGPMPAGGTNRVEIAVCSIPALLAMKGHALRGRYKQKDAYDIYYCIRNYPGGIGALAEDCRPILAILAAKRLPLHRREVRHRGDMGRPVCGASLRIPRSSAIAPRSNGSKMPSVRLTNGCERWAEMKIGELDVVVGERVTPFSFAEGVSPALKNPNTCCLMLFCREIFSSAPDW